MTRIHTYHPGHSATAGPDRRVHQSDLRHVRYAASSWTRQDATDNGGNLRNEIEVQAFTPDGQDTVIAVVVMCVAGDDNFAGSTSLMLSGDEARAVAESLILAANDYDRLRDLRSHPVSSGDGSEAS